MQNLRSSFFSYDLTSTIFKYLAKKLAADAAQLMRIIIGGGGSRLDQLFIHSNRLGMLEVEMSHASGTSQQIYATCSVLYSANNANKQRK